MKIHMIFSIQAFVGCLSFPNYRFFKIIILLLVTWRYDLVIPNPKYYKTYTKKEISHPQVKVFHTMAHIFCQLSDILLIMDNLIRQK